MDILATSEVLNRAADLIEERGWQTGSGWPSAFYKTTPLCLEGGIMAALGLTFDYHIGDEVFEECPAYHAVHEYLALSPSTELWQWNDRHAKDAAEVVEVLRATAVIEAARENADVEVSA